jgi:hypothetical protein
MEDHTLYLDLVYMCANDFVDCFVHFRHWKIIWFIMANSHIIIYRIMG